MLLERKYLIDLYSVSPSSLEDIIKLIPGEWTLLVHTGFFRVASSPDEVLIFSSMINKLAELSREHGTFKIEIIDYIPERMGIRDLKEDVNHFLVSVARELDAGLITGNEALEAMASSIGLDVVKVIPKRRLPSFIKFFTDDVMSLHLKEGAVPRVKRGRPGSWRMEPVGEQPLTRSELEDVIREILEVASSSEAVKEVVREYSMIVQLQNYRIVVTKPPLSDGIEVTIVRPLKKLKIEDYNLPPALIERLGKRAEGILIAGAPGMGKTTFAQALAEFYARQNRIIKTIESPRDMDLPAEITQLSKSYGTSEELHDVLLLSRPDYTIFDEMRDTKDFELYADMRLAGVGMVGVIHATAPIDAIQRFLARVDLGILPSIIDTVIFIHNGEVAKVYTLETTTKIPHGLRDEDLARPVVLVKDFYTGEPEYEIYVFGERTFVVPVKRESPLEAKQKRMERIIKRSLSKYVPPEELSVEMVNEEWVVLRAPSEYAHLLSRKARRKIERLGKKLGAKIEVFLE